VKVFQAFLKSALFGAALLAVAGCNRHHAQAGAPPQMPPPGVTVAIAIAQDVPVYLDEIGKCTAFESVTITPQIAGIIIERRFEDGADLKAGQVLFRIDPRPFKATLDSANAQLAQAKASEELAKLEFDRYAAVANTAAISKSDFDIKKNAVDVAKSQVAAADAAVESAQLNLNYCEIRSPIDGRAGARLVDVGNVVKANEGSLLLVQRLDPIYADFTITEHDLPEVQKQMARGILKTQVRLPIDSDADAHTGNLIFRERDGQIAGRSTQHRPPLLARTVRQCAVDTDGQAVGAGAKRRHSGKPAGAVCFQGGGGREVADEARRHAAAGHVGSAARGPGCDQQRAFGGRSGRDVRADAVAAWIGGDGRELRPAGAGGPRRAPEGGTDNASVAQR
jgi:RND family efflux transporter MFP subunit